MRSSSSISRSMSPSTSLKKKASWYCPRPFFCFVLFCFVLFCFVVGVFCGCGVFVVGEVV